jgi:hypothetical protein
MPADGRDVGTAADLASQVKVRQVRVRRVNLVATTSATLARI